MHTALLLFVVSFLPALGMTPRQAAPVITAAYEKEVTVDGVADPNAGPITIIDVSATVEARIGAGGVSADGSFTAVVNPPPVIGTQLVAVDKNGMRSSVFTVVQAYSGPPRGTTQPQ